MTDQPTTPEPAAPTPTRMVRLQAVGWRPGTPVADLAPGDRLMWNYGTCTDVVACAPLTEGGAAASTWLLTERSRPDGYGPGGVETTRRKRGTTLVVRLTPAEVAAADALAARLAAITARARGRG